MDRTVDDLEPTTVTFSVLVAGVRLKSTSVMFFEFTVMDLVIGFMPA
jgi:hypothetical protein